MYLIVCLQNIDTLERVAGVDGEKLVEAHGTFHTSHCVNCGESYTQDWIKGQNYFTNNIQFDPKPKLWSLQCEL